MCEHAYKNDDGYEIGDIVTVRASHDGHPFVRGERLLVDMVGETWVQVAPADANNGNDERWAALYNDAVTRPVIAANGAGPGAGPGARLAATLRALGKRLKAGA
jgi:hypothetical protein